MHNQIDDLLEPAMADTLPSSEAELRQTEKVTGPLPKRLRAYLERLGSFSFKGEAGIPDSPAGFLSVLVFFGTNGQSTILDAYRDEEGFVADGLVPIGRDELDNIYSFSRSDGSIWFSDFSHGGGQCTRVAANFDEFIESIKVQM